MRIVSSFFLIVNCLLLSGCIALVPLIEESRGANDSLEDQCPVKGGISPKPGARAQFFSTEDAIKQYVKNLRHKEAVVRINAASGLGELGSVAKPAVKPLIIALSDRHYWVRRAAVKSLGNIGDPRAVKHIAKRLQDSDPYVASSAANALKKIGTPAAIKAVRLHRGR